MIDKIRKNLDEGAEKVKWYARLLNERVKVEIAVVKLLARVGDLEKDRERALSSIGERVYEIKERGDVNVLKDEQVERALAEVERIDAEIKSTRTTAAEAARGDLE